MSSGGGIDTEVIEIITLPLEEAKAFIKDDSKPKTSSLLFAIAWFFMEFGPTGPEARSSKKQKTQ